MTLLVGPLIINGIRVSVDCAHVCHPFVLFRVEPQNYMFSFFNCWFASDFFNVFFSSISPLSAWPLCDIFAIVSFHFHMRTELLRRFAGRIRNAIQINRAIKSKSPRIDQNQRQGCKIIARIIAFRIQFEICFFFRPDYLFRSSFVAIVFTWAWCGCIITISRFRFGNFVSFWRDTENEHFGRNDQSDLGCWLPFDRDPPSN